MTKVLVAVYTSEGVPRLVPVLVSATEKQIQEGDHYAEACRFCEELEYEVPGWCIDEQDGQKELFDAFNWDLAVRWVSE